VESHPHLGAIRILASLDSLWRHPLQFPHDILTPRLRLAAITPPLVRAQNSALSQQLSAEVPDLWPHEHWEPHVLDFLDAQYLRAPHTTAWNRYILTRFPPFTLIGNVNGFPKTETEAEIGYVILEPWQRHGFATEALRALIDEILRTPLLACISAQTFPHLKASVRVLEKCGFQLVGSGDEEGTVRYRLARPQPHPQ